MSYAVGENAEHRDIGYGVPAECDYPTCEARIDRGVAYACGGDHDGGCGRYFCDEHRYADELCPRCDGGEGPYDPKPDLPEWVEHKATHPSWAAWRAEQASS